MKRLNFKTLATVRESYNSKREKIIDKTGIWQHRAPTGIRLIALINTKNTQNSHKKLEK